MQAIPTYTLSDEQSKIIAEISQKILPYRVGQYDAFIHSCLQARTLLPANLVAWVKKAKDFNCVLIRNLPVEIDLMPTPLVKFEADNLTMVSDSITGLVAQLFGNIYTFKGKTTNRHIHNVYPALGEEDSQLGFSQVELEWHVEDGFHAHRPDWVGLFCLREDQTVVTKIARCTDILSVGDIPAITYECDFELRIDDSFGSDNHESYIKTALLSKDNNDCQIVFDPYYTRIKTLDQSKAIEWVKEAAALKHYKVILRKGDFLFFDNRRTIHSRSAYAPLMNGTDRWIKRVLVLDQQSSAVLRDGYISLHQ